MNTTSLGSPLARRDDLIVQEFPGETVVYDLRTHAAHSLNPAATLVLKHCDGRTTLADIADILARECGGEPGEDAVRLSLRRLDRAGLLDHSPAPVATDGDDLERARNRRAALRAVKVGAVAVVASLAIPEAAFASP